MTLERFEKAYQSLPGWEIGKAQPALVELERRERFGPSILDIGCGTGELTLHLASCGYDVLGVDIVPAAIDRATAKAAERNIPASFAVGNALELENLKRRFDTIVDCGVFHTFPPQLRGAYRDNLSLVLKPGGFYYMLVWSDQQPGSEGPLRITREDITGTFAAPWRVHWIEGSRFAANHLPEGARAWLAKIERPQESA